MKKIVKWVGITLGSLVALIVLIALMGYVLGGIPISKTYDIPKEAISVPTDCGRLDLG